MSMSNSRQYEYDYQHQYHYHYEYDSMSMRLRSESALHQFITSVEVGLPQQLESIYYIGKPLSLDLVTSEY